MLFPQKGLLVLYPQQLHDVFSWIEMQVAPFMIAFPIKQIRNGMADKCKKSLQKIFSFIEHSNNCDILNGHNLPDKVFLIFLSLYEKESWSNEVIMMLDNACIQKIGWDR